MMLLLFNRYGTGEMNYKQKGLLDQIVPEVKQARL